MKWLVDGILETRDKLRDEVDIAELEYWAAYKDAMASLSKQADALEKWRLALHKYNDFLEELR